MRSRSRLGSRNLLRIDCVSAQGAWARSVALLAQNRPDDAGVALAAADRAFDTLSREAINQQRVLWLGSRIEQRSTLSPSAFHHEFCKTQRSDPLRGSQYGQVQSPTSGRRRHQLRRTGSGRIHSDRGFRAS